MFLFLLIKTGVKNLSMVPLPLPYSLLYRWKRKRPNNVKGGGGGSYFYQGISKHRFLGKGLNNYVPDCR